ncbi:phage tail protein [Lacticaseibacillus paracasei]|uniref:phage tail protein n=1 Tax=Lacticaseibacillus paracasei TaxID=1597 RepID=UPI0009A27B50|nr:phage tail protein [Lacticaseibacillus paracasei]OPH02243.1 phage tail protein [Lacticaseibacillus paracasei]
MEYYFADRKSNILGVGSTDGKGEWQIDNDIEKQSVDNRPAVELSLDIKFTTDQEQAVNEMVKATNFILYQDEEGNAHQMVIESVDHDSLGHIHSIVASDAGNDLINETVGAYKADKPYTIADYITRFTNDSGWEIGINEFPDNVRTLEWTSEESSLARIIAVAKDFDAVLSFGFEFVGTNLVKRVINIRHETAGDSLISFEMNKDINNIVTHRDTYDMETSIKAYGAVPESTDGSTNKDPINLIGYNWTNPTGQFVLDQYGFLHDTIAIQKYSRLLSNSNPNPTQSDWNRVKTFDSKSQAALLQAALADLKKYNHPNETYDIDLVNSPYVPLNQTVHIADENQQLFLSAKVLSIQRSRANHSVKLTLGEFAHETVSFDERLSALANQMANMPKTIQYYPWLRYADDDQGTNMSAFPTGKKYMAIVWSNKTSVPSDNPADYARKWALIQGKDGADGVPGAKGADGRTSYFHTAWADDVSGQSGFTVSGGDGKKYIGTYSDFTHADSTNPSDYNWARFKGEDGDVGPKGDQGLPGAKGADGRTAYTHFAYANSQDGHADFSTTDSNRKYIGFYSDFSSGDSTNPSDYSWSLIKGADGANGKDGVPGKAGADGKTSYFHIAYADSSDGKTNFSLDTPGSRKYIGSYTDFTQEDSTNPAVYSWQLVQGPKGDTGVGIPGPKGADGKTSYFHTAYANSIDGKQGFSTTNGNGKSYFGQYVDQTQADSTDPTKYSWALFKGPDGRDGKDGSDNVPVVTVGPSYPAKPKGGDQHWLTDEDGNLAAFAIFDTTSGWDSKPIAAKALNVETFNGMTFNGVTFNGSTFISSFNHIQPDGFPNTISGTTKISGGSMVTNATLDSNSKQTYQSKVDQLGLVSKSMYDGKEVSSVDARQGMLTLKSLYNPSGQDVTLVSTFTAADSVFYQHIDSGLETNDVRSMKIGYSRKGPNVTIGIAFEMKTGNGWVKIANIRPGYSPFNNDDAARLLGSMSYTGAACQLYVSAGGIYIIPWRGQGRYAGSLGFITRDAYPINDAVVN